jgi:hypothetical protein
VLIPRFRLRTQMVAVAIAAIALGGVVRTRRAAAFAKAGEHHRNMARWTLCSGGPRILFGPTWEKEMSDWHLKLAIKYECAAHYPWTCVDPDPPMPVDVYHHDKPDKSRFPDPTDP